MNHVVLSVAALFSFSTLFSQDLYGFVLNDHVYKDFNGNIQRIVKYDTLPYFNVKLNNGGQTTAPLALTDPHSITYLVNASWPKVNYEYCYVDFSGNIISINHRDITYSYESITYEILNNDGATNAPPAAATPAMFRQSSNNTIRDYAYIDNLGNIFHIRYDGHWWSEKLNNGGKTSAPPAASSPVSMEYDLKTMGAYLLDYAYRDEQGGVQHIYWANNTWYNEKINNGGKTNAPPAVGNISSFKAELSVPEEGMEIIDYIYRDESGNLQHVYWFNRNWYSEIINNGGTTLAPPAVGDPTSGSTWFYDGEGRINGRILDYAYRDAEGNIWHVYWYGYNWYMEKLNNGGVTTAPPAAGDPSSYIHNGLLHYTYRDINNNLQHVWWINGTWSWETLNNGYITDAPACTGKPVYAFNGFHMAG